MPPSSFMLYASSSLCELHAWVVRLSVIVLEQELSSDEIEDHANTDGAAFCEQVRYARVYDHPFKSGQSPKNRADDQRLNDYSGEQVKAEERHDGLALRSA